MGSKRMQSKLKRPRPFNRERQRDAHDSLVYRGIRIDVGPGDHPLIDGVLGVINVGLAEITSVRNEIFANQYVESDLVIVSFIISLIRAEYNVTPLTRLRRHVRFLVRVKACLPRAANKQLLGHFHLLTPSVLSSKRSGVSVDGGRRYFQPNQEVVSASTRRSIRCTALRKVSIGVEN